MNHFVNVIKKKHSRIIYVLGLCLLILILFHVGYVIEFVLYGVFNLPYDSLPANIVQITLHVAAFVVVIAVGLKDQNKTLASVCFFRKVSAGVWCAAILCTVGFALFNFYIHFLFYSFIGGWYPGLGITEGNLIGNASNSALIPAVCEELLFKGLIFSILKKHYSLIAAILIASLMFAAVHLSFIRIIPLFLFSAYTFWIYLRSGSLVLPIFYHFIHNLFTLVLISEPFANLGTFYAALALFAIGTYMLHITTKGEIT